MERRKRQKKSGEMQSCLDNPLPSTILAPVEVSTPRDASSLIITTLQES